MHGNIIPRRLFADVFSEKAPAFSVRMSRTVCVMVTHINGEIMAVIQLIVDNILRRTYEHNWPNDAVYALAVEWKAWPMESPKREMRYATSLMGVRKYIRKMREFARLEDDSYCYYTYNITGLYRWDWGPKLVAIR